MSDNNGGGSAGFFIAGLLVGAALGAVATLLFAPAPGEETRELLSQKGIELKGKAKELSDVAKERAETMQAKGRITMEEQLAKLEEAVEEGKKTAAKTREELLGKLEKARSTEA
jgi:gas vesicle protein